MKQVELEYLFPFTIDFMKKRFSTASGLNEWFADDVAVDHNTFTFRWKNNESVAKRTVNTKDTIRFEWQDDVGKFTQFKFIRNKLNKNTSVIITETFDDDETEDEIRLYWDNLMNILKRKLGVH